MMNILLTVISFLFICTSVFSQSWEEIELGEDIKIKLPSDWKPLSVSEARARSFQERAPLAYYLSPNEKAEFVVTLNQTPWSEANLELLSEVQKANIMHLYNERVQFMTDSIVKTKSHEMAVLEFSAIADLGTDVEKKYVCMGYSIYKNMLLVLTFSCDKKDKVVYKETAWKALMATRVKKG